MMHDSSFTNTDKTDVYGKMLVFSTRAGVGRGVGRWSQLEGSGAGDVLFLK